jgi:predicted Rossmann fold flavoprotein
VKKRVVIIGAGASGLMAACRAAGPGIEVTLVEKQKKTGRKLLATGNGRCNISTTRIDASRYHGRNPKWVNGVFSRFGLDDTVAFFESIGVPFVEGENGRLFPASLQASSVQKMLEYEASRRGVNIRLHRKIERILPAKKGIQLVTAGQEEMSCDSLIVAAGSCAYSPLGASRDGYDLAASLGHRVYEPLPAIIPLNVPLRALHHGGDQVGLPGHCPLGRPEYRLLHGGGAFHRLRHLGAGVPRRVPRRQRLAGFGTDSFNRNRLLSGRPIR